MGEGAELDLFMCLFVCLFLCPHLQHVGVLGLHAELELQLLAYTTAHGKAESLTHCERPGIEPTSSWILLGFVTAEPPWELLDFCLFVCFVFCLFRATPTAYGGS